jgi:hypothetical protein
MNRKEKRWLCPSCPQTSARHGNLKIHIKRKHNGIGCPIQAGAKSIPSPDTSRFVPNAMNFVEHNNYHDTSSPSYQRHDAYGDPNKEVEPVYTKESQNRDPWYNLLHDIRKYQEFLREWVEIQDLIRRKSPSPQQPITMNDVLMLQWLASFSRPNISQDFKPDISQDFKPDISQDFKPDISQDFKPDISQDSTNIATNDNDVPLGFETNNAHLPIGFRVLSCNRCLADNWFEYVFSRIETVALTKVIHLCDLEVIASKDEDEPRNSPILIEEEQNHLMVKLRRAVDFLASMYEEEEGADLPLQVEELHNPQLLQRMQNTKLPIFKLWILTEDCIDLRTIDHDNTTGIERGMHWVYRAIKKEAIPKKIIKINRSELANFLNIAKATFGIFAVKSMDGTIRYFLMHIVFRRYDSWRQQQ